MEDLLPAIDKTLKMWDNVPYTQTTERAGMLERDKGPTKAYAWLIAIDVQEGVNLEDITMALADSVSWMEGTAKAEVELLGPLDVYPEEKE